MSNPREMPASQFLTPHDRHCDQAHAQLWERQPEETDPAFQAFEMYRAMGRVRSLAKVGCESGKHVTLIERWSVRHRWRERVEAWDRHEARAVDESVLRDTAQMRSRLVNAAPASRGSGFGNSQPARAARRWSPYEIAHSHG